MNEHNDQENLPISRRKAVALLAGSAATMAMLACASRTGTPPVERFEANLPIPHILRPTHVDGSGEYFEIETFSRGLYGEE